MTIEQILPVVEEKDVQVFIVTMTDKAKKMRDDLPKNVVEELRSRLKTIATNPTADWRLLGLNVDKIINPNWEGCFRLRWNAYRCAFQIEYANHKLVVVWVGHKKNAPW